MPMEIEKTGDLTGYAAAISAGREPMKSDLKEQLLRDFDLLSEDQKLLAAEYIKSLRSKLASKDDSAKNERIVRRLNVLKEMDKLASEIGKNWKEDIDAVELLSSMRR